MKIHFTIRAKILLFILVPVLIAASLLAFFSYGTLEKSYENQIAGLSLKLLDSTAEKVKLFLTKEIDKLQILARNPILNGYMDHATARYETKSDKEKADYFAEMDRKWIEGKENSLMDSILTNIASQLLRDFQIYEKRTYHEIFVTDRWGGLVAATNKTGHFYQADQPWWQSSVQSGGRVFLGDLAYDPGTESYSIPLSFPIRKAGEETLLGVVKVVLDVNQLFMPDRESNVGRTGFIRVFNHQGEIIFDPNRQNITRKEATKVLKGVKRLPSGFFKDFSEGIERLVVFKYVDLSKLLGEKFVTQNQWYFCMLQAVQEAFEPFWKTQRLQMIRMAVTTVLLLLGTLYLGRRFTDPLSNLVGHTRELARGNFRTKVEIQTNDEFGELGEAFNQMRERLDYYFRLMEASEHRYRALFESAKEGVLVIDRETSVIVNANSFFCSMLGREKNAMVGQKLSSFLMEIGLPDFLEDTKSILLGEMNSGEVTFRFFDGAPRVFEVSSNRFELEGKQLIQCLFRDVTDKKQIEEIKNNLIRDVAHELRTPIAKLHISMDLLIHEMKKSLSENDKVQSLGEIMKKSIRRLSTTVENILDFSRLQEGVVYLKREKFYLIDLLQAVVADYLDLAQEKNLSLRCSVEGQPFLIEADKRLLKMAVGNLVSNAIKFTSSGEVIVKALQEVDKVQIWIQDTGVGIAPESMPQIFEKFFQVSPSIPGCGIGLAISDEIIKLHGGKIWAESRGLGQGTTFKVELMNSFSSWE